MRFQNSVRLALAGSLLLLPTVASGELTADHVAVVANARSADSLSVARHYAARRGIPSQHVIALDLPTDEEISRQDFEKALVQPLRRTLQERGLSAKVRALVTTYGVPLRLQAPKSTGRELEWLHDAEERIKAARVVLAQSQESLQQIAPVGTPQPSAGTAPTSNADGPEALDALIRATGAAVREAGLRMQQRRDHEAPATIERWTKDLAKITGQIGGVSAVIQSLQPAPNQDERQAKLKLEHLRRQVGAAQLMIQTLNEGPSNQNRQRAYRLTEKVFGQSGILRLASEELVAYTYKDGDAGVDSELSMLWWDAGEYRVAGRLPNPLHYEHAALLGTSGPALPVMLVSRLDAPTPALAKQLVEQALAAEQYGLNGKVYLDARGMKSGPPLSYEAYDQSLRDLAGLLRRSKAYEVVLENTDHRFSRPGEAPDVAMYVGWYKLREYEDAFTFRPGAIGYHIASGEAVSIHDAHESGWCKNALERGITATLGPVGEPYLDSFPLPEEFLSLWLTGRYSLVEAYYLTSRYVSWRMALFGDPLYNPWRGHAPLDASTVSLKPLRGTSTALPSSPSDGVAPDPVKAREALAARRDQLIRDVDRLLEQQDRQGPIVPAR